jgi:hypothetical protein
MNKNEDGNQFISPDNGRNVHRQRVISGRERAQVLRQDLNDLIMQSSSQPSCWICELQGNDFEGAD